MAQIYKRIYTYTGQASWTPNERSVPLSSFAVTGDINKNIGQIVSIRYEHTHSSGSSWDWTLTGRLVLSNGATIDSTSVTQRISKNTVVQFVNNFTTLPTAAQFAQVASVQTLDTDGSAANNGVLSWKANAQLPIRLIVEFYDQPPTMYAPKIDDFYVERVDENNLSNDEGTRIATTLRLSFASGAPTSTATVKLYTSTSPDTVENEINVLSKVNIANLISGVELNTNIITGTYSAGTTFYFTLVVAIGSETATASAQAFRAKAPIHITNDGVSFGNFSSATAADPKEEFHNRVVFYKGFSVGEGMDVLTSIGIQHGKAPGISIAASTVTEYAVTFPKAYASDASAPNVVATFDSTGVDMTGYDRWDYLTMTVCDITATGFKLRVKNGTTAAFTLALQWAAFGIPK